MKYKTTRIHVTLPEDYISKAAKFKDVSFSEVTRRALELYFEKNLALPQPPEVGPNPFLTDKDYMQKSDIYRMPFLTDAAALDKYFEEYKAATGEYPPERSPTTDLLSPMYKAWKKTKAARPYIHLQRFHPWHPKRER